jgi:hypothetical protein
MKVNWPMVRKVTMVTRFCKVIGAGPVQFFSDFMDSSKRPDERNSQEESEAETQDYFTVQYSSDRGDSSKRADERGC